VVSNFDEYVTGTDPTDGGSFFGIDSITLAPDDGDVVTWQSAVGRNYVVYHSEPLSGIWLPLSGTLAGTGGELSFTDPEDGLTERFYRIGVTLP
jgi:hypothetical protein